MGRFETQWLTVKTNLSTLSNGYDRVHGRRPPTGVVLDMDYSVSPTHGEQEMSLWNGHYECTCYHPLFVFNQFDLPPILWTPDQAAWRSACSGVIYPRAEWSR